MSDIPSFSLSIKTLQVNTCDQNVNRCCDLIELTSRVQGQLFYLLNLSAAEGLYIVILLDIDQFAVQSKLISLKVGNVKVKNKNPSKQKTTTFFKHFWVSF